MTPTVDVNLFAYNAQATIGPAIESVLAQTWPDLRLTVLDNASGDATASIAEVYAREVPRVTVLRAQANRGALANCARAFAHGSADFVLPKTADDLLAPEFVARAMEELLAHPGCAMASAAGLVFEGAGRVTALYPPSHAVHATGPDPRARAATVMAHYTSAPSFWGIYRRAAVDRLSGFRYRAGWDHAVLAELALYGDIRHIPAPLYWRRDGGKPVAEIARGCTEAVQRGLGLHDPPSDPRWRTPLITTAYNHLEGFAVARVDAATRAALMDDAVRIFRTRWAAPIEAEAAAWHAGQPSLRSAADAQAEPVRGWMHAQLDAAAAAVRTLAPG